MSHATHCETELGDCDTIVAVATAPGRGGVGIVRLSGPAAIVIAEQLGRRSFEPRCATFTRYRDADGDLIDEGITLTFEHGASFTGETVAELQAHGGPVVMLRLVRAAIALGARPARPGEFSERAFLNGRLDLTQLEAVADLIAASTEAAARGAVRSLSGAFSNEVNRLADSLREIRGRVEADIDFPDEGIDAESVAISLATLVAHRNALTNTLSGARRGARLAEGAVVAIVGPPNAGKSSLLNVLAEQEVAIVSDVPGTTRDVLNVDFSLHGLPVRLLDTAGIRVTSDAVEQEGVRRAMRHLAEADLVVLMRDISQTVDTEVEEQIRAAAKQVLTVGNKSDLGVLPGNTSDVLISIVTGEGLGELKDRMAEVLGHIPDSSAYTARARHVDLLERCATHMDSAIELLSAGVGAEFVAEELRLAGIALGEIVGQVTSDELLGDIFSRFCIGK